MEYGRREKKDHFAKAVSGAAFNEQKLGDASVDDANRQAEIGGWVERAFKGV